MTCLNTLEKKDERELSDTLKRIYFLNDNSPVVFLHFKIASGSAAKVCVISLP